MSSKKSCSFLLLTLFLYAIEPALAQTGTATVSGVVHNPAGNPVTNVTVSIRNVVTSQTVQAQTDDHGRYTASNLTPGNYEVSVAAAGLSARATVTVTAGPANAVDLALSAANPNAPSLGDLGFTPEAVKGSAQDQARLDRRSHMLKTHQRLGLITTAPLIATLIAANGAAGHRSTAGGRELHAALGATTAGLYFATASFAIFAPKIQGSTVRGPIRIHRALAWIHGPGMILTPILGALAYEQRSKGEKVHGIAQAHGAVGIVTAAAYGAAILSVSIKF